jgi:hypothetical protein
MRKDTDVTAGLPGTGIGGLFYLISALLMPFREAFRAIIGRGDRARGQEALKQGGLALTILGAIWVTGLALGLLHIGTTLVHHATVAGVHILYITPVIVAFATLSGVLIAVEVAHVVLLIKEGPAKDRASSHSEAA